MANFSSLKQSIQNYIKQNGNKEITGNLLQTILLSMVTTMGDGAINDNASDISDIKGDIQNINGSITDINGLISAITTRLNTGAVYAGYATPSTTPALLTSQEVFYLATQAGTYTNFHFNGGNDPIILTKDGIYFIVSGDDDDDWNAETIIVQADAEDFDNPDAAKRAKIPTVGAVADVFGHYVENPEWIYVLLDRDSRTLAGIKSDGSVDWSIGVPAPVKEYVENVIAEIKNGTEGTDIDGINKIITFLSDFSTSDTLKDLLDTKVDKEEGKSLIDAEYAEGVHYVENPEFIKVVIDGKNGILYGIQKNGNFYFGAGVPNQIKEELAKRDSRISRIEHCSLDVNEYYGDTKTAYTLEEAIALVPEEYQHGGLTLSFISRELNDNSAHSSDNRFVQYRLMSDVWSINPDDWAAYNESIYTESPQYKKVLTDRNGQMLNAINNDTHRFFLPLTVPYVNTESVMFLNKDKTFAEQVLSGMKKYVIAHDFDLDGEEINIPDNTILTFFGGSVSNGVIKGDNIIIEGEPRFVDLQFIGSYSCDEYDYYGGNITSSSNVALRKSYPKGTYVEVEIKNLTYTSSWEPNIMLQNTTSEQSFLIGLFLADCKMCAETIFDTNKLRIIYSGDDYSYECRFYKKTINLNKALRGITTNVSPKDYTYCQVPAIVANKKTGNIYGCFVGSKSTYNEQDFNIQYNPNSLDNGVEKNPKQVVLFKKTNGFNEIEYVEVTKTIGQEATDSNYLYVRSHQNTNILLYGGYINILSEGIKKSDGTKIIGYYQIPEDTLIPESDKLTPCTLDGVEFSMDNIPSIVADYGIEVSAIDFQFWLPQNCLAEKSGDYYQCGGIKLSDDSLLNIIMKTSDGGVTWESLHAFINNGDESAICINGNDMYIIQRQSPNVLKFKINTRTFDTNYSLKVPISTMRPFAFFRDNVPYVCTGIQHQFRDGGFVTYRFGYNIINALDGSFVKFIYDEDGLAYCVAVVMDYGLVVAYTSCKRFKGEQNDYIIGYDGEQPIHTSGRPLLGCCSDCQITELSLY